MPHLKFSPKIITIKIGFSRISLNYIN